MQIQLETDYIALNNLSGKVHPPGQADEVSIPGGILRFERIVERRGIDAGVVVDVVLYVAGGVASTTIANWLWDKIQGRVRRITINRTEILEITETRFKRVIRETIEKEE